MRDVAQRLPGQQAKPAPSSSAFSPPMDPAQLSPASAAAPRHHGCAHTSTGAYSPNGPLTRRNVGSEEHGSAAV